MIFERTNPEKNIICADLANNNIVFSERIDPLKMQDIGSGFVPYNLDDDIPDKVICISKDEVVEMVKQFPF